MDLYLLLDCRQGDNEDAEAIWSPCPPEYYKTQLSILLEVGGTVF